MLSAMKGFQFTQTAYTKFCEGARKLASEQKSRRVPSPSTISDCIRRLWYKATDTPPSNPPDHESYVTAETGRLSEPLLGNILVASGLVKRMLYDQNDEEGRELESWELERGALAGGQVDNIAETEDGGQVLIEFKRRPAVEVARLWSYGIERAQPHHFYQVQALLHAKGLRTAYYVVVAHSRREVTLATNASKRPFVYIEKVRYNRPIALQLKNRAIEINRYIKSVRFASKVPTRSMIGDLDPAAKKFPCATVNQDGDFTPWCPYYNLCSQEGVYI